MTTQQAIDIYNVLQDKYGSPNQIESEIIGNLNMGMFEWLNRISPDNQGGIINFEFDSNVAQSIAPLVYIITENMDGDGLLTNAAILSALQTESSDPTASVFRVKAIGITDDDGVIRPVRYIRQNNLFSYFRNKFKRPSATRPRFDFIAKGYKFYPVNEVDDLTITVIKNPKLLSLSPVVNPELDDYAMYNIIAIALKLGGIETRDEELIMDVRNTGLQIAQ